MTNEERDALIAQGWTPPVAVDPDLIEARKIASGYYGVTPSTMQAWSSGKNDKHDVMKVTLTAIKRGRALAAAEAKPGMFWKKNRGLSTPDGAAILTLDEHGTFDITHGCRLSSLEDDITHYAIITPPEEDVK